MMINQATDDYVFAGILGMAALTLPTLAVANQWVALSVGLLGIALGVARLYFLFREKWNGRGPGVDFRG